MDRDLAPHQERGTSLFRHDMTDRSSKFHLQEARRAADLERLLSQVDRDLAPYRERGIDLRRIEQQYCEIPQNTMRFQVGLRV